MGLGIVYVRFIVFNRVWGSRWVVRRLNEGGGYVKKGLGY